MDEEDDFKSTSSKPATDLASGLKVPIGHCFVNEKWRGTAITTNINKLLTVKLMDGLGAADFQPGNNTLVMLLSEADIIREEKFLLQKMKQLYKQKQELVKKKNVVAVIVFAKTPLTEQYLSKEIGQVLEQLGTVSRQESNPFEGDLEKKKMENSDKNILLALMAIPNLGEKKARALLKKFGSLRGVARARAGEMEEVVGSGLAKGIEDFFRRKNT